VSLERRKVELRTRRAGCALASFRSPLTTLVVALSLIVQLVGLSYQQALAAPAFVASDTAVIAADLKAVFGDAAYLCAHIDDNGGTSPHAPCGHCDDHCALCRFAPQLATALVPPDAFGAPQRLDADCETISAAPDFGTIPAAPTQRRCARAPPLAV
jgi:hypothetical protein